MPLASLAPGRARSPVDASSARDMLLIATLIFEALIASCSARQCGPSLGPKLSLQARISSG